MPAFRRVPTVVLTALLVMSLAGPSAAAASTDPSVSAAEAAALAYANKERTARGLIPLRLDPRVAEIAHARAETMADEDELSHDQADGNNVFDILSANDVTWYGAGEIIAYNYTSNLTSSAKGAVYQWMHSTGHRNILLSKSYNYVAFGLAVSASGKRYWAGVYIKGPDRTGAWAKLYTPTKLVLSSTRTKVTFRWVGSDTTLQVLTAGLRYYEVQKRVAGGEWSNYPMTTATVLSTSWSRGRTYEFRIRALDRAGNWGGWRSVTVTL